MYTQTYQPTIAAMTVAARLLIADGEADPIDLRRMVLGADIQQLADGQEISLDAAAKIILRNVRPASIRSYTDVLVIQHDRDSKRA